MCNCVQDINVLFCCHVSSFIHLASSRGTGQPGAVPAGTLILFTIGDYISPWNWLTTREKAEAMAEEVSQWRLLYNMDGIDINIESGAGDDIDASANLIHFIEKLRELDPGIIINQPTFGYPQVLAQNSVINASWNPDSSSNDLADSIGIMVYEGTSSLEYVENYAHGSEQWEGFPITVNVPYNAIMAGSRVGSSKLPVRM